jgi:hypothetical protein
MRSRLASVLGAVLLIAGCDRSVAPAGSSAEDATASKPAVAATTPTPAAPASVAAPVSTVSTDATSVADASVFQFAGYGPARFGASEEAVRQAFGRPFADTSPPDSPEACHVLVPEARTVPGFGLRFMIEGGRFVRYDVTDPTIAAPGRLTVGMAAGAVEAAFPGQVERQPHKYVPDGSVLVVRPADGGASRLVLETDAAGTITAWRIGLEPQVHYVEGCG